MPLLEHAIPEGALFAFEEMVPSRVMRKFVCRFWLNEVSQQ